MENLLALLQVVPMAHRVGHSIAFAYLKTEHCNDGVNLTVETSLGSRSCHVSMNASYDQNNEKLCS